VPEPAIDHREAPNELQPPPSDLRITNLTLTYPGTAQLALQDISISLPPGGRIAIVGPSGAGKSTLNGLLLRFWNYSQGRVMLNGRELREYPQDEVRRQFSVLSQRSYFFNDTIRNNLLLARPEADESGVREAARRAQMDEFIMGLPKGYDTVIGERGLRLSGGERQRLALARALLKDAPIFLLDEPTAHLDGSTERLILEVMFSLSRQRSLLLVTHRLVGLEVMDEILVLERGRIVQRGRHADLIGRAGLYQRLWNIQTNLVRNEI
jgi:ABC-type multidrug transport system fused ATPase/permease subunit